MSERRREWVTQVNRRGELMGKVSPRMDRETVVVREVLPGDLTPDEYVRRLKQLEDAVSQAEQILGDALLAEDIQKGEVSDE